jgi:hypothetical protein
LIEAGSRMLDSDIHVLNHSIWSVEELAQQWMESRKKGDKIDGNNCQGILLLSATYRILSNISL